MSYDPKTSLGDQRKRASIRFAPCAAKPDGPGFPCLPAGTRGPGNVIPKLHPRTSCSTAILFSAGCADGPQITHSTGRKDSGLDGPLSRVLPAELCSAGHAGVGGGVGTVGGRRRGLRRRPAEARRWGLEPVGRRPRQGPRRPLSGRWHPGRSRGPIGHPSDDLRLPGPVIREVQGGCSRPPAPTPAGQPVPAPCAARARVSR